MKPRLSVVSVVHYDTNALSEDVSLQAFDSLASGINERYDKKAALVRGRQRCRN